MNDDVISVLLREKNDLLLSLEFYAMREHWVSDIGKTPSCHIDKGSLARYTMGKYGSTTKYLITEIEYKEYLEKISKIMDNLQLSKEEEKELIKLVDMVIQYEEVYFPIGEPE
jgi:hypothetical protein